MFLSSHALHSAMRCLLTLCLALCAAVVCVWAETPIPWMIGPLLATSLASVLGVQTLSANALRNVGQWVIGAALGLYFTPAVGLLVVSLWWVIGLGIAWALSLGLVFSLCLYRWHAGRAPEVGVAQWRATAYFAGAIGGASEMTLIAERHGARTDLVASAHSLRVLLVTVTIPFVVQVWGVRGLELGMPGVRDVHWGGLALLGLFTLLGALLMQRLGRANPWFMGALLVTMVLTLSGVELSAIPVWLLNAAQLVIGVSLGVRFTPEFMHTAPRWLASVAAATAVMMLLCAGFAWLLAGLTGLPWATLVLGTSPGGIAEMAITAKVLQLGVPVVTAFQVCRLVAVLVLAEPVFRWWCMGRPQA